MTPAPSNRPRLGDIQSMPISEIAALPADQLALLQEDAAEALRAAKSASERLDSALTLKYGNRAWDARQAAGKDAGTVRFADGPVTVIADLPKKVDWDQQQLAALVETIRTSGDDPADYVTTEFKVSERAYGAWPARVRNAFTPARTVRAGKLSVRLCINQENS